MPTPPLRGELERKTEPLLQLGETLGEGAHGEVVEAEPGPRLTHASRLAVKMVAVAVGMTAVGIAGGDSLLSVATVRVVIALRTVTRVLTMAVVMVAATRVLTMAVVIMVVVMLLVASVVGMVVMVMTVVLVVLVVLVVVLVVLTCTQASLTFADCRRSAM